MKIDEIDIQDFAKEEYSGFVQSKLDGKNLLIVGENRTGKTLSMNAILYDLLGPDHTIDLATGRGNNVTLTFTNGIKFYRGASGAKYENGDELKAQKAQNALREQLCKDLGTEISSEDIIKVHFLHSHTEQLPLSTLSKQERIGLIRSVTDIDVQEEIEYHERATTQIKSILKQKEALLSEAKSDLSDLNREVSSAENELKNYQRLFNLLQEGKLREINSQLQKKQSVRDEISEIYREKEGIRQERRTLNKEKRRWEKYHENEVYQVIAEAVYDFVCPVCEHHIDTDKAKNRLSSGYCPFCAERRPLTDLKENMRQRIGGAGDQLDEVKNRIDEIDERLSELGEQESRLKKQAPEISDLDSFVERQLRQNKYTVDGLEMKAKEEIERNKQTVDESEGRIEDLEEVVNDLKNSISNLESSIEEADHSKENLEESSGEQILAFQELWEEEYQDLANEIGLDIRITPDGEIVLPGNTNDRTYDQDGDLSDAEMRLLNVSFSVTVNEFVGDSGISSWGTLVLDEPFANLDRDGEENLIRYIHKKEQQFIITTSNTELQGEFPEYTRLQRNTIQTTFNQFD